MPGNYSNSSKVAIGPARPVLVFDGDCGFCRRWIARWRSLVGEAIEYVPFQDPTVAARFPDLPLSACETAVQLVEKDGRVCSGAEAVFKSLASVDSCRWLIHAYRSSWLFATFTELAYRLVARNRMWLSLLERGV